jgi:preprotein translocase subunit YajC
MLGSLFFFFVFFAQAAPVVAKQAAPAGNGEPSSLNQYFPFLMLIPVFYFMVIRPQQVQDKKRRELINALKKNDKVLTAAGMYGTVISVDEKGDRVQLRLDDDGKVKITFTKASIVRVISESSEKTAEAK